MGNPSHRVVVEGDIAVHAAAIRRLARHLVRDAATADDVTQEAMRIGLERRPASGWPMASWLRGVVRNVARNRAREERRRVDRERGAARPEAQPSTADAVVRVEEGRRLLQAVLALPEPVRTAIAMRYFDGAPPRTIAMKTGAPVETVRTRIKRGVELLRDELDREHRGQRRAWILALAPLASRTPNETVKDLLGGLAMGAGAKVTAAAAVVMIGVVALWQPWVSNDGTTTAPPQPQRGPDAENSVSVTTSEPAAPPALAAHPTGASTVVTNRLFAAGVVVDADGRAVAGARVLVRRSSNRGGRSVVLPLDLSIVPLSVTDTGGSFEVVEQPKDLKSLVFVAAGLAPVEVADLGRDHASDLSLRVVLMKGRSLTGFVRDAEGRGVIGATVGLGWPPDADGHSPPNQLATTDAKGAYSFDGLPAALKTANVSASGYEADTRTFDAESFGATKDFKLRRIAAIVDVTDSTSGQPLRDARGVYLLGRAGDRGFPLIADDSSDMSPRAVAGRLYLWPQLLSNFKHGPLSGEIVVFASGHRSARIPIALEDPEKPPHLSVPLDVGAAEPSLAGRVVGGGGALLEVRAAVHLDPSAVPDGRLQLLDAATAATDGTFSFNGLPNGRYRLRVIGDKVAPQAFDVVAPDTGLNLVLRGSGSLSVRVVSLEGVPQPGVRVIAEPVEGRELFAAESGRDGLVLFDRLPVGLIDVAPVAAPDPWMGYAVEQPGRARARVDAFGTAKAEVVVARVVPIVLRVIDPERRPVAGVEAVLDGSAAASPLITDTNGEVRVELGMGGHSVVLVAPTGARLETPFAVPLRPQDPTTFTIAINGGTLTGRMTEQGTGAPLSNRTVLASVVGPTWTGFVGRARSDSDGRYSIVGLPRARLHLRFGAERSTGQWPSASRDFDFDGVSATVDATIPRTRGDGSQPPAVPFALTVTDATSREPLDGAYAEIHALRGDLWIDAGAATTGEDGRAETKLVEGERYRVEVRGKLAYKGARWKVIERDLLAESGKVVLDVALEREPSDTGR